MTYEQVKADCNTHIGRDYNVACMDYFLSLPIGTGGKISRQDFASTCSFPGNAATMQCRVLCRDHPEACAEQRRQWCRDTTDLDIRMGRVPLSSPFLRSDGTLYDPRLQSFCACYLPVSENEQTLHTIGRQLGTDVERSLEHSILHPICYSAACASSQYGLDTDTTRCPDAKACIQYIEVPNMEGKTTVTTSNRCVIVTPSAGVAVASSPSYSWWPLLWILGIIIVLGTIILLYQSHRAHHGVSKQEEYDGDLNLSSDRISEAYRP